MPTTAREQSITEINPRPFRRVNISENLGELPTRVDSLEHTPFISLRDQGRKKQLEGATIDLHCSQLQKTPTPKEEEGAPWDPKSPNRRQPPSSQPRSSQREPKSYLTSSKHDLKWSNSQTTKKLILAHLSISKQLKHHPGKMKI